MKPNPHAPTAHEVPANKVRFTQDKNGIRCELPNGYYIRQGFGDVGFTHIGNTDGYSGIVPAWTRKQVMEFAEAMNAQPVAAQPSLDAVGLAKEIISQADPYFEEDQCDEDVSKAAALIQAHVDARLAEVEYKQNLTDAYTRILMFFDHDDTAAAFMAEDGDGGLRGAVYRMAREIDRLRLVAPQQGVNSKVVLNGLLQTQGGKTFLEAYDAVVALLAQLGGDALRVGIAEEPLPTITDLRRAERNVISPHHNHKKA